MRISRKGEGDAASISEYAGQDGSIEVNLAELLTSKYQNDEKYRDRVWTTDIPDAVELYTSFSEPQSEN